MSRGAVPRTQGATGTRPDPERGGSPLAPRSGSPKGGFGRHPATRGVGDNPSRAGDDPLGFDDVWPENMPAHIVVHADEDERAAGWRDPWTRTDVLLVLVFGAIVAFGIFVGFSGWGVP